MSKNNVFSIYVIQIISIIIHNNQTYISVKTPDIHVHVVYGGNSQWFDVTKALKGYANF